MNKTNWVTGITGFLADAARVGCGVGALLVVLAGIPGCRSSTASFPDSHPADILIDQPDDPGDAPLGDRDSEQVSRCDFTADCREGEICESGACRPLPCLEGMESFCYRGLRALCLKGGGFSLESCGPGMVCERDECRTRMDNVILWVGGHGGTQATRDFLDAASGSYRELASRAECVSQPGAFSGETSGPPCECDRVDGVGDIHGTSYGVLIRYMARSLLEQLGGANLFRYSLASPPQREVSLGLPNCFAPDETYSELIAMYPDCVACRGPDSCETGMHYFTCPWGIGAADLEAYWSSHPRFVDGCGYPSEVAVDSSCIPPRAECRVAGSAVSYCGWPLIPSVGNDGEGMLRMIAGEMFRELAVDKGTIARWFNEDETESFTGDLCGKADCSVGWCSDGRCTVHSDPEIFPYRIDNWSAAPTSMWALAELIARGGGAEKRSCSRDEDCGNANYVCGEDGLCHDDAGYCRRNHLVIVDPLSGSMRPSHPSDRGRGDFSMTGLVRWMSIGLVCSSAIDCDSPATCRFDIPIAQEMTHAMGRRFGVCSDGGRDPGWLGKTLPECSDEEKAMGCGNPNIGQALQDAMNYLFFQFPVTPYLADASGRRVRVRTHVMNLEDWVYPLGEPSFSGLTSFIARAMAINGGGNWVVPGWSTAWNLAETRNWRDQIRDLSRAILLDATSASCDSADLDPRDLP